MTWDETKAKLNKALDSVTDETSKLVDKGKSVIDTRKLNNNLNEVYTNIGKAVYSHSEENGIDDPTVKALCDEAKEIIEKIDNLLAISKI